MELVFGKELRTTSIDTEERQVVLALDKGDKCVLVLGINRVEVEYVDGSWTVTHTGNIVSNEIQRDNPRGFVELGADLRSLG